ncbi:MAG TPA: methylmalonyl Co-A mutase-associated GTPase MeaB [Actinomycetota bacterium]|nr:methylmalonyl Co-A mutase-associated GTPase MeaB [Actinomycetota bacterium]
MDVSALVEGLRSGDRRTVARMISLVEDASIETLGEVMRQIGGMTSHAYTIGVTGSPGVGKSTLTGALVSELRKRDRTVSVLAIDPTSHITGGALLGDRLRMQEHATDPGVFIRSMATRGHLGGLAWAAPHALRILDAAGVDTILVETVGVGQDEVEISAQADTTIVALAPGMGDSVQANKAGILEIADVYVVNKADREGAKQVVRDIQQMLELGAHGEWLPPVLMTTATDGTGVDEVLNAVDRHREYMDSSGEARRRRLARAAGEIREIVIGRMRAAIGTVKDSDLLAALAEQVVEHELDPYAAADKLLAEVDA